MSAIILLSRHVESFFRDRLVRQLKVSDNTIHAYRDSLKLFFNHIAEQTGKPPHLLEIEDLSRDAVIEFLNHLEADRKNSVRTRNNRLAAIRSFFNYIAIVDPERMHTASRILSIPCKKGAKRMVGYLIPEEIEALLSAPDQYTKSGRRNHLLLLFLLRTGARVSEAVQLNRSDLRLTTPFQVLLHGKGDKERCVPLSTELAERLREHLKKIPADQPAVFLNARGSRITRHGVAHLINTYTKQAAEKHPSIRGRKITPHILRHTTAMCLLHAGVDLTTIRSWLGHSSVETTHLYVEADLKMKEAALAACNQTEPCFIPYKPPDDLLAFLESL